MTNTSSNIALQHNDSLLLSDSEQSGNIWRLSIAQALAGANAVVVGEAVLHAVEQAQGRIIPNTIGVEVTRDYGETANEKATSIANRHMRQL